MFKCIYSDYYIFLHTSENTHTHIYIWEYNIPWHYQLLQHCSLNECMYLPPLHYPFIIQWALRFFPALAIDNNTENIKNNGIINMGVQVSLLDLVLNSSMVIKDTWYYLNLIFKLILNLNLN